MKCCKYIHTYIHTYIRTYIHTYIHTYVHTYIHTYIRTYVHTYIHTYIHTYTGTRMYIIFMSSDFAVSINFLHVRDGAYDKKQVENRHRSWVFSCHCLSLYISIPVYVQLLCDMIYVCTYVLTCMYVCTTQENKTGQPNQNTKNTNKLGPNSPKQCTCMYMYVTCMCSGIRYVFRDHSQGATTHSSLLLVLFQRSSVHPNRGSYLMCVHTYVRTYVVCDYDYANVVRTYIRTYWAVVQKAWVQIPVRLVCRLRFFFCDIHLHPTPSSPAYPAVKWGQNQLAVCANTTSRGVYDGTLCSHATVWRQEVFSAGLET